MSELDRMLGHADAPRSRTNGNETLPVGLPMPRQPELLFDFGPEHARHTATTGGIPFPVPNGWFVVVTERRHRAE